MNTRTSLLVLALFGCWSAPMTLIAASPEEKYFETRDNFIRQFEKSIDSDWRTRIKKNEHALAELEKQLTAIVGPVNVEGFPKQGKINLQTLEKDYGFGQADGLSFSAKQENLFVTTDNILKKYLAEQPELPKDLAQLSRTGEFYVRAITAEAAVTYYAEIPVKSANEKSYVHAFLGLTAQDIGPIIPKDIFVFVTKGNRILAVQSPAATEITEIPQCRNEWERFVKKRSETMEVEKQGFEAYHRCYEREAKNQKFFASLEKQAQSVVDRLLRN